MPCPSSEDIQWRAIQMKEMSGYQMDEVAASLKMALSFDPTTLIEIAVYCIVCRNTLHSNFIKINFLLCYKNLTMHIHVYIEEAHLQYLNEASLKVIRIQDI